MLNKNRTAKPKELIKYGAFNPMFWKANPPTRGPIIFPILAAVDNCPIAVPLFSSDMPSIKMLLNVISSIVKAT